MSQSVTVPDRAVRAGRALRRPAVAVSVLAACYLLFAVLVGSRGSIGGDVTARVATVRSMTDELTITPDLGYWAEAQDPDGSLFPFGNGRPVNGAWVTVGTLPTLYPGMLLYFLGGTTFLSMLPIAGSILGAWAARSLACRLDPDRDGMAAFWCAGLLTPLLIYAPPFWDHSLGAACVLWAVALAVAPARPTRPALVGAGALLGVAVVLRGEAFVYAAVVTGIVLWRAVSGAEGEIRRAVASSALVAGPLTLVLVLNDLLERVALGGSFRTARVAGYADDRSVNLVDRLRESAEVVVGMAAGRSAAELLIGAGTVVAIALGTRCLLRSEPVLGGALIAGAALAYVASVLGGGDGPESIVGFFTATPLAIVGILVVKREQRWIAAAALVPIPLVLASKASEEAASSWGVRYLIPSALLLVVMAVTARPNILTTCVPVVVLAALVSLMGIAFEIDRSHGVADLAERISERPEDVVVARPRLLLQEAGAFWDDQQWLWAADARAEREAASIAVERDAQSLVVLVHQSDGRAPEVAPYCLSSEEAVPYASGGDLTAYVYQLPAGQAGCDRGVT